MYFGFSSFGVALADFTAARAQGTIGDISHMYISQDGLEINVMNNDFLGGTDKYMTGAMSYGWLKSFEYGQSKNVLSYEVLWDWRALTPAESQTVGGKPLKRKIGRFADWMDLRGAVSYSVPNSFGAAKFSASLALVHIGNKGIKDIHHAIHKEIGMQTSGLEYTDQPTGLSEGYEAFGGQIMKAHGWEFMVGAGIGVDKAVSETFLQLNLRREFSADSAVSCEATLARQLGSVIYDGLEAYRYEVAASIRVFTYYQPGVKWVSSFVKDDPQGQLYAELLRFNVPL